jgi:hypothetical protein
MYSRRYTAVAHQAHLISCPTSTFGTIDKAPMVFYFMRGVRISIPNMQDFICRVVARSIIILTTYEA